MLFLTAPNWGDVYEALLETEKNRTLTIVQAVELFHFAGENEEGVIREFWMNQALDLLNRIDGILVQAQVAYQNFLNREL